MEKTESQKLAMASILTTRFRKRSNAKERQGYAMLGLSVIIVCLVFFLVFTQIFLYSDFYKSISKTNERISYYLKNPTQSEYDKIDYEALTEWNSALLKQFNDQSPSLITTNVISMGIVLTVGFFLVQIFLKLYRYNMNLANFYCSLADSFLILELEEGSVDGVKFEVLVNTLLPRNVSLETPEFNGSVDLSSLFGKPK